MKICYISFKLENPRDQITLRGFEEIGVEVKVISPAVPGIKKYLNIVREYRAVSKEVDLVMVGYAGNLLVVLMKLVSRKPVVYNALATFYDSMIVSRFGGEKFSLLAAWYYLVDFLAFQMADLSFLECQAQKDLAVKIYKINPKKISVHFVGTDDREFYFDPKVQKLEQFTAVFRGMFLAEAGADVVVRAAKELEGKNIWVRIIGRGLLLKEIENLAHELKPANLELITERLPMDELRQKMLECHLSLGQLALHPRVHTTIPHKLFESMSMKLAYLTGENKGALEVLKDGVTCFTVPPGDHQALARKILELSHDSDRLTRVSENAYQEYIQQYSPKILAEKIMREIAHYR